MSETPAKTATTSGWTSDRAWMQKPVVVFLAALAATFCSGAVLLSLLALFLSPSKTGVAQSLTSGAGLNASPSNASPSSASPSSGTEEPKTQPAQVAVPDLSPSKDESSERSTAASKAWEPKLPTEEADPPDEPPAKPPTVKELYAGEPQWAPFMRMQLPIRLFDDENVYERYQEEIVFDYDERTATLGVCRPWEREVGFLRDETLRKGGNDQSFQLVRLRGTPNHLVVKSLTSGSKFVVCYSDPSGVAIIDPTSLEIEKTVTFDRDSQFRVLAPRDPSVNFVYVGSGGRERVTYRVNCESGEIERTYSTGFGYAAVNADGSVIMPIKSQPFRIDLNEAENWKKEERKWRSLSVGVRPFVDPAGRFVSLPDGFYMPDLQAKTRAFQFKPVAVSVENSWCFAVDRTELVVASLNDGAALKRFTLPKHWRPFQNILPHNRTESGFAHKLRTVFSRVGNESWADVLQCRMFADDTNKRLLIAGRELLTIPYDAFGLERQPRLLMDPIEAVNVTVGQAIEIKLPIREADSTVELLSKNGTVEGEVYRWTPKLDEHGSHMIEARVSKGTASHISRWPVTVERGKPKTLPIDFDVENISVSNDESMLVAAGRDRLEVLNLRSGAVMATKESARSIYDVAFFDGDLLVVTRGDDDRVLNRLKLPSLKPAGHARIGKGQLVSIADRFLVVRDGIGLKHYKMPEMAYLRGASDDRINGKRVSGGWTYDGVLYDETFANARLLIRSTPFISLSGREDLGNSLIRKGRNQQLYVGYVYDRPSTEKSKLTDSRTARQYSSHVLPARIYGVAGRETVELVFESLDGRTEFYRHFLHKQSEKRVPSDWYYADIAFTESHIYVVHRGKVYVIQTSLLRPSIPRPFQIFPVQSTMVLKGNSAQVRYEAPGATSFTLELAGLNEDDSIEKMESDSGVFTVEMPDSVSLAERAWKRVISSGRRGQTPVEKLKQYMERISESYMRINRRKPSGVPLMVTAYVQAIGPNLETDVLGHCYLVEVPLATMRKNMPRED